MQRTARDQSAAIARSGSRTHPPSISDCTRSRIFVRQDALTPATSPSCTTDTIAKAVHLQRDPSIQRRCAARGLAVALLRVARSDHLSRRGLQPPSSLWCHLSQDGCWLRRRALLSVERDGRSD